MTIKTARTLTGMALKKAVPATIALLLAAVVALIGAPMPVMLADSSNGAETSGVAPGGLSATFNNAGDAIQLSWTPGRNPAAGYDQIVQIRDAGIMPPEWTGLVVSPTDNSAIVPVEGVFRPGTTYIFQVTAATGTAPITFAVSNAVSLLVPDEVPQQPQIQHPEPESQSPQAQQEVSQNEEEDEATTAPQARKQPSNLVATYANGRVTLAWLPGTNRNYVKQIVKRRVAGVTPVVWTDVVVGTDISTYADIGITAGERYIYRIRAEKINGVGSLSNQVSISIPGAVNTREATDLSVAYHDVIANDNYTRFQYISITWTAPTHPAFNRMQTKRRVAGVTPIAWTNESFVIPLWPGVTRYTRIDFDPAKGETYIYRVDSFNRAVKVRTSAPVRITIPE